MFAELHLLITMRVEEVVATVDDLLPQCWEVLDFLRLAFKSFCGTVSYVMPPRSMT